MYAITAKETGTQRTGENNFSSLVETLDATVAKYYSQYMNLKGKDDE